MPARGRDYRRFATGARCPYTHLIDVLARLNWHPAKPDSE